MMVHPYAQSATRRRELRRKIRNILGVGRDDAPNAEVTLRAASAMNELVKQATASRFELEVWDNREGKRVKFSDAILEAKPGGNFYIEWQSGNCSIVRATDSGRARERAKGLGRIPGDTIRFVRPATADDLDSYNSMGGTILL